MVLPVCVELFIRFIFTILKFMLNHWFLMLWILIIAWLASRNHHVYAWILTGMDAILDSTVFATWIFGTAATYGILSMAVLKEVALTYVIATAFGILWAVGVLISDANPVLKFLSAPIYFGIGVLIAILPGTFLANLVFGYGLKNKTAANIICGLPILLFLIFGFVFNFIGINIMCDIANYGLSFFAGI